MTMFRALLHDENGFIISTELVVIATLLVVGLITGLQVVQTSVVGEMNDVAGAIGSLNQSYSFAGKRGCCAWGCGRAAWTGGSCFVDCIDETRAVADFGCSYAGYACPTFSATYTPSPVIERCLPSCPPACSPSPAICPPAPQAPACLGCPPVTSTSAPILCLPDCASCSVCQNKTAGQSNCVDHATSCVSTPCSPCAPTNCRMIW